MLIIVVAASLLTVFALYITGAVVTEQIELVFAAEDAEKVYDGTPLYAEGYKLVSGELQEGHVPVVEYLGAQTDAGEGSSSLSVKIYDEKGFDVSNEYKIGVESGLLKVLRKDISVVLEDEKVVYNGSKVIFENYKVTSGELVTGHRVGGSRNVQLISVNDPLPYDLRPVVFDAAGKDVSDNYNIDFTMGEVEVVPRSVTVKPVDLIKVYDGTFVTLSDVEVIAGSLADGHYFKEVEINYGATTFCDVCDETTRITRLIVVEKIGSEETDVTENYEIDFFSETGVARISKRPLTVTAKSDLWEYDGKDHYIEGDQPHACEGLAPGEKLISVEYAGIIRGAGTEVSSITEIHLSNTADNYDITYVPGTLTVTKRSVTIVTPTVTNPYNGEPLKGVSDEDVPDSINLAENHILVWDADKAPSLTEFGTIRNKIECWIVDTTDGTGEDLSQNYNITYAYGQIIVTKRTVWVTTPSLYKEFDGAPLYGYETVEDLGSDNLVDGHSIVPSEDEEKLFLDQVDKISNRIKVFVQDGEGNDVTKNYDVQYNFGTLEITRLTLRVKTSDGKWEYDGQGHDKKDWDEDEDVEGMPAGALLRVVFADDEDFPRITNVNESCRNKRLFKLVTADGADVDGKNYRIEYDYGWLEITPYNIYLTLRELVETYSGKAFEIDDHTAEAFGDYIFPDFLDETAFKFVVSREEIVNVGVYSYWATFAEGYDDSNFILRASNGIINIEKCTLSVTLNNFLDYIYDSTEQRPNVQDAINAMTRNGVAVADGDAYLNKGMFRISASGDLTNAGNYTYTVKFVDTDNDKNYDLVIDDGYIKISKYVIDFSLRTWEETYNGKEQLEGVTVTYVLNGNTLPHGLTTDKFKIVSLSGGIVNASDVPYEYVLEMIDTDLAENYVIDSRGTLKVNRKALSIEFTADVASTQFEYDGNSHMPTNAEDMIDNAEELREGGFDLNRLDLVAVYGDMTSAGTHTYTVVFKSAADEINYELEIRFKGEIKIEPHIILVTVENQRTTYNGKAQSPVLSSDYITIPAGDAAFIDDIRNYFEIDASGSMIDANEYAYGIRTIYNEKAKNFQFVIVNGEGNEAKAKFTIGKIRATLTSTVNDVENDNLLKTSKIYDGTVFTFDTAYAVGKGYITLNAAYAFTRFTVTCATTTARACALNERSEYIPYAASLSNLRIYDGSSDITHNFDLPEEEMPTVELVIAKRDITFMLENYTTGSATARPDYSVLAECLRPVSGTPLPDKFYITFNTENITYNPTNRTLRFSDFESIEIFNEAGENVTDCFNITNLEDGNTLTSSIIVIE